MKIAIVGAFNGNNLNDLYKKVKELEKKDKITVDLVLICGNLEAARNAYDLKCVDKLESWKSLNDFNQYYKGSKKAKYLTLVIGGDHEASNYYKTLPYGGWIAPNIWYMGNSGVVNVNGVKIGGLSGTSSKTYEHVFKTDIQKHGYFEKLPFDLRTIRSVCYTRYLDVYRMLKLKKNLDVLFTFDWPTLDDKNAENECLLNIPLSRQEDLHNDMYRKILEQTKPRNWFAGKLNHELTKVFKHKTTDDTKVETNFCALKNFKSKDDCNIKIIDIQGGELSEKGFEHDSEWLSILKATDKFVSKENQVIDLPDLDDDLDLDEHLPFIKNAFKNGLGISKSFSRSLPVKSRVDFFDADKQREKNYANEQTSSFCKLMEINDINKELDDSSSSACCFAPLVNWLHKFNSEKEKN